MSKNFEIKKLSSNEWRLAQELFLYFQIDDGEENPTSASGEYLFKLLEKSDIHVLIATKNGALVGGLAAYELMKFKDETTEMFLYEIGVKPEFRRRGAAAALIGRLKAICAEKGIAEMFVETEADNFEAIELYRKTGGKDFKVVQFDYEIK